MTSEHSKKTREKSETKNTEEKEIEKIPKASSATYMYMNDLLPTKAKKSNDVLIYSSDEK